MAQYKRLKLILYNKSRSSKLRYFLIVPKNLNFLIEAFENLVWRMPIELHLTFSNNE